MVAARSGRTSAALNGINLGLAIHTPAKARAEVGSWYQRNAVLLFDWSDHALKLAGCLMLLSGWIIVLAALVLLPGLGLRAGFIAAGLAVEILGLGLIGRGQVDMERRAQALAQSVSGTPGFRTSGQGFGGLR